MTISQYCKRNKKDFGLNADWNVSVYKFGDHCLFDLEDGNFELYFQPEIYRNDEDNFIQEYIDTFENEELERFLAKINNLILT